MFAFVLGDACGERDRLRIIVDPFPMQRGDFAAALAGEDEEQDDGAEWETELLRSADDDGLLGVR